MLILKKGDISFKWERVEWEKIASGKGQDHQMNKQETNSVTNFEVKEVGIVCTCLFLSQSP